MLVTVSELNIRNAQVFTHKLHLSLTFTLFVQCYFKMEGFTSTDKRKGEPVHNDSDKQRRVGNSVQSNNPPKITDVNQFCLEKIFAYLDLENLLNVADANKYLRLATYSYYARHNEKKPIHIMLRYVHFGERDENVFSNIAIEKSTIFIIDFKSALQMLRCFGHMIHDIVLQYSSKYPDSRKANRVMSYINEFCAESLIKIDMNTGQAIEEFKKTFHNIETVAFSGSLSGDFDMNKIFPKLRHLICSTSCNPASITPVVQFPNLEHLQFSYRNPEYIGQRNQNKIADFLRLNPQLRSFTITFNDFNVLRFIAEYLNSIESLDINCALSDYCNENAIMLPNVRTLSVHFCDKNMNFPILLPQLKEFTLKGNCKWDDSFLDFIKEHKSIEKISIETRQFISLDICSKIMEVLSTLQSISIIPPNDSKQLTLDAVLGYLAVFKIVQFVHFKTWNRKISEDNIRNLCSEEWHITCVKDGEYNHFTLRPLEVAI